MIIQERGQPRFLCRVEITFNSYKKGDEILLTLKETIQNKEHITILKTLKDVDELSINK